MGRGQGQAHVHKISSLSLIFLRTTLEELHIISWRLEGTPKAPGAFQIRKK